MNKQVYSRNTTDKHVYCTFKQTKNKGNKFIFACFPIENQRFNQFLNLNTPLH